MKMPPKVIIDTTNRCNSDCIMCLSRKGSQEMPKETFERLAVELFPFADEYHTTVNGEPLMTTYFCDIPPLLEEYGVRLNLTTNGTLLTPEIAKLILPVLRRIKVSFDGSTKGTFESIRRGSCFETVVNNIRNFVREREPYPDKPQLALQVTLMRSNIGELTEIVRTAYDTGADEVKVYLMVASSGSVRGESLARELSTAKRTLEEAKSLASGYGLKFSGPKERPEEICHCLFDEAWIEVNGDVVSCCHVKREVMGNIYESPFADIWNNEKFVDMRRVEARYNCCNTCSMIGRYNQRTLIIGD